MYDCVSIGSATEDVFVFSAGARLIRIQEPNHEHSYIAFDYGDKVMVEELFVCSGGGAVNNAVGLARLGLRSGIVCEVGNDEAARTIKQHMEAEGVDTSMIVENCCIHTGYSVILTGMDGDRTVLVHRGAARYLSKDDVDWERVAQTQWVYLGAMAGDSAAMWDVVAEFVKEHNLKMAINPGTEQFGEGLAGLRPVMEATEVIFVNQEEAYRLTEVDGRRGKDDEKLAMRLLHEAGCRIVVMTQGKHGASAFDGERYYYEPAPEVTPVSNLGAGDAFAVGCVGALWRGLDLQLALRAGAYNSGGVISEMGASKGLLTWDEMQAKLNLHG